ncbi:hypothetical protein RCL1_005131 [Eukaryota sp. TZLM3-RCL]
MNQALRSNLELRKKQLARKKASEEAQSLSDTLSAQHATTLPAEILDTLNTPPPALTQQFKCQEEEKLTALAKFNAEVSWAINQLELGLKYRKPSPSQAAESRKIIQQLQSSKISLPRKRHLLHVTFGGKLREFMQKEENSL